MRLRPQSPLAQGESLRSAPQVFRRDETGRGQRTAPPGATAEGQLNTELVSNRSKRSSRSSRWKKSKRPASARDDLDGLNEAKRLNVLNLYRISYALQHRQWDQNLLRGFRRRLAFCDDPRQSLRPQLVDVSDRSLLDLLQSYRRGHPRVWPL